MKKIFYSLWLVVLAAVSVQAQVASLDGTFSSGSSITNTSLRTGTTTRMTISATTGYVGINTLGPTAHLDVTGYTRLRWVPIDNTLTQMLMIDGLGNVKTKSILPFVTSSFHLGIGYNALPVNLAEYNTAVGLYSMYKTNTGEGNTALGDHTLYNNTSGKDNTVVGAYSMYYNVDGIHNTAVGYRTLINNTEGQNNVAIGSESLVETTTGTGNTAVGWNSLTFNRTGYGNTALGCGAGVSYADLINTTAIGAGVEAYANNQVRIGDPNVTSIGGQVSWSTLSDGRFKKDVREDVAGLGFIRQLRPVSYVVDRDAQNKLLNRPDSLRLMQARQPEVRQTGFIAQEVEEVVKAAGYTFNAVDAPQEGRGHYSLRYSDFVVPLVRAVQELSAQVEELQAAREYPAAARSSAADDNTTVRLYQNTPNPFTTNTTITMTLPDHVKYASIVIYNLEGKQLKRMDVTTRGDVNVVVTAQELPAGMYLYSLLADGKIIDTKRMVLTD